MREFKALYSSKTVPDKVERKTYLYFNNLSFLSQLAEKRLMKSSLEGEQDSNGATENGDKVPTCESTSIQKDKDVIDKHVLSGETNPTTPASATENGDKVPTCESTSIQKDKDVIDKYVLSGATNPTKPAKSMTDQEAAAARKRNQEQFFLATELKILNDISKCLAVRAEGQQSQSKILEDDEDRLFLLSLLKYMKDIEEYDKLIVKSEIILLIRKYLKTCEFENKTSFSSSNLDQHTAKLSPCSISKHFLFLVFF